jgi:hypothetical protein
MTVRRTIMCLLIGATLLAVPAQFLIDPTVENVACACIVAASSLSVLLYIAWSRALEVQPLSTFAVLGLCTTTQLGAVLVQTVAWTAVSKSLYSPLYTFATLALYQGIALLTHAAYCFFSASRPARPGFFRGILGWAGVYRIPSCGTLWLMGCVGLVSFFFSRQEGNLFKFVMAFNFLAWTPFLIPFYVREIGAKYCNAKRNRWYLGAYILVVGMLGMALNARGIMFVGILTVGLLYLLAGMRSQAVVTGRSLVRIGALAAVLLVLSGPLSDLTTSMAIARQWRGKVSAVEMIKTTYSILRRPALIKAVKAEAAARARYSAYDEHYIENPVLGRFVTTKYHDNMLHFAGLIDSADAKSILRDITVKFLWSALPGPALDFFGVGGAKDVLNASMGDYLAYLGRGTRLGAHIVGSIFAHGIALFGPLFPFIYAAICFVLFGLMDLLTIRSAAGVASVSALGMLEIWNYFAGGLSYDALSGPFEFIIRNFWQTAFIYALVFGLARWVMGPKGAAMAGLDVPALPRAVAPAPD